MLMDGSNLPLGPHAPFCFRGIQLGVCLSCTMARERSPQDTSGPGYALLAEPLIAVNYKMDLGLLGLSAYKV